MGRRGDVRDLAIVLAAALGARTLLFHHVGVWGDFGFWAYDSRMILQGRTPFVDFPGRSPLMVYVLAAVRDLAGMDASVLRWTVIGLWTLAGIPTYLIARHVHSHHAGLTAAVLFLLTPFSLVYGMWLNSQSLMVVLALTGLYVLLRRETPGAFVLAGGLFGLAFLSRRSVVVVPLAIGGYYIWEWTTTSRKLGRFRALARRGSLMTAAFLATLLVGYGLLAGLDPGLTWAVFQIDFVGLFYSNGRGTYPMVGVEVPAFQNSVSDPVPVLNWLCQVCGAWTARVGLQMVILGLPVFLLLWPYTRAVTARYFTQAEAEYTAGALGALALYALYLAVVNAYVMRALAVIAIAAMAIVVYRTSGPGLEDLVTRDRRLLVVVLAAIVAGYLYRNRRLHVYYMLDAWALWSVLAAVAAVEWWPQLDRSKRLAAVAVLAVAVVTSGAIAYPFTDLAVEDNRAGWFTPGNMDAYADDLDRRVQPGETVLTAHPSYVVASYASLPRNSSRVYMTAYLYNNTRLDHALYQWLLPRLRNDSIPVVVLDGLTRDLFRWNASAERLFEQYYCRVASADRLYNRTHASLYRYQPNGCAHRPRIEG